MQSHLKTTLSRNELIKQKLQNIFLSFDLPATPYPLFQEILGALVGIKVSLSELKKVPDEIGIADKENFALLEFKDCAEKTKLFIEELSQIFPKLVYRFPSIARETKENSENYKILLSLDHLEQDVFAAIRKYLGESTERVKRLQLCAKQTEKYGVVMQKLNAVFKEQKISIYTTHCLEETIYRLATKTYNAPYRSDHSHNDANHYSVDFNFLISPDATKKIEQYFNQFGEGCVTVTDQIESYAFDHRFFPKLFHTKITVDSALLLSEPFLTELRKTLKEYSQPLLETYQIASKDLEEKSVIPEKKPSVDKPKSAPTPPAKRWYNSDTLKIAGGALCAGLFLYKVFSKPSETLTSGNLPKLNL